MTRLAIVQEAKDFHIVGEQEQIEAAGTVLDNFKASVSYLYQNTDLFGSAKDITVPPIRYPHCIPPHNMYIMRSVC